MAVAPLPGRATDPGTGSLKHLRENVDAARLALPVDEDAADRG
jgi:hypothetical protein